MSEEKKQLINLFAELGLSRSELGVIAEILNGGLLDVEDGSAGQATLAALNRYYEICRQWDLTDEQGFALAKRLGEGK